MEDIPFAMAKFTLKQELQNVLGDALKTGNAIHF